MKIVFMGTPDFALASLQELEKAGHQILAVYSQPPRPAGRGYGLKPSPVQAYADQRGWEVRTPKTLKTPSTQEALAALSPDVIVVAAYGLILPGTVLTIPPLGCINVHGSLLPRWRGAAPLQRALLAGDSETGITIMKMDEGLDTGPMLRQESIPLSSSTTFTDLHDEMATLGGRLLIQTLEDLEKGLITPLPQPSEGITYAAKLEKQEGLLSWTLSAEDLERKVRALNPWPGVWFQQGDQRIKVFQAEIFPHLQKGLPGEILDENLLIQCAQGALRPLELQKAGGKRLPIKEFLRGHPLPQGMHLPCPATN